MKIYSRYKAWASASLLLGVTFVYSCSPAGSSNSSTVANPAPGISEIRFGSFSTAVDYGPYLLAKDKGWFEEAVKSKNIRTTYTTFQSLPPINESFATSRVDIVFEAEPPAIIGKAAGIDINIVGLSCSLVQEILVPSKSSVKRAQQLKGKKIAVLAGTSSHYGLFRILETAGVQPSEVEVIDMVPPDAKTAFATGRVDAWAVWPPWIEQEELAGTGRTLPGSNASIQSIMAARGEFVRQHPDVMRDVSAVIDRAKLYLVEHAEESQQIIARALNVPVEVTRKAWPRHSWAAQLTPEVIADIQAKADFLKKNNFIRTDVNVAGSLVNTSFRK
jgi:sulfonate transport system substrate-binding protein